MIKKLLVAIILLANAGLSKSFAQVADTRKVRGGAVVSQTAPTATLTGGGSICADGSTSNLTFAFTGTGPWDFDYTDGTTSVSSTSDLSGIVIAVSTAGTYYLTSVSDSSGAGTVSGTATVIVNEPPVVIIDDVMACIGSAATLTASGAVTYLWSNSTVGATLTDSPVSTKSYTVMGTDMNNCVAGAIGTIIVNSLPTISITASPSSAAVCQGTAITLAGEGASTYTYIGGTVAVTDGQPFTPTATVTYTVTGIDTNNCSGTTTRVVTVNPVPVVGITVDPANASICSGQAAQVTLTGTGAQQYMWTGGTDTVTNNIAFSPSVTATYTVTGTILSTSCSSKATKTVSVNACGGEVGIAESSSAEELKIYPNPTSGIFNISIINASFSQLSITIFDITGAEVYATADKYINSEYIKPINLEGLSPGLYYIQLFTGNDIRTKKLIIQ